MTTEKRKAWEPADGWMEFDRLCVTYQEKQVAVHYGVSPNAIANAVRRRHGVGFKEFKRTMQAQAARAVLESTPSAAIERWIETGELA